MKGLFFKALCAISCVGLANSYAMESYFDRSVQEQVMNTLSYWSEIRSNKAGLSVALEAAPVMHFGAPAVTVVAPEVVETITEKAPNYFDWAHKSAVQGLSRIGSYMSSKWSTVAKPALTNAWNTVSTSQAATQCQAWYNAAAPHVSAYAQKIQPYTLDVVKAHPYVASAVAAGAVVGTAGYIYRKPIARAIKRVMGRQEGFSNEGLEDNGVKFVEVKEQIVASAKNATDSNARRLLNALRQDVQAIKGQRSTNEYTSAFFLESSSSEAIIESQKEIRDLFNAMVTGVYIQNNEHIKPSDARFEQLVTQAFQKALNRINTQS